MDAHYTCVCIYMCTFSPVLCVRSICFKCVKPPQPKVLESRGLESGAECFGRVKGCAFRFFDGSSMDASGVNGKRIRWVGLQ